MSTPIDALGDELKRRMENPFWGSFIISWLIINWKVVLVVLSWNSQKIDDKINYIESLFPFDSMLNASISLGHLALFPLIASFVAVWFIPILAREYLRKQIKNKEEDDSLKIREIKSEVSVNKEQQTLIKEVANTKKLEKSLEDNWEEEYEKLTRKYPDLINELTSILYTHEGWAGNSPEYGKISEVNELTTISKNKNDNSIHLLTPKGKYFLKKHSLG